jgi:serine/threonine protein kinase
MGEVYRPRDTRLGREVAIKIVARAFTADAGRLARFEREARVFASLNLRRDLNGPDDNLSDWHRDVFASKPHA